MSLATPSHLVAFLCCAAPLVAQQEANALHDRLVAEHVEARLARAAETVRIQGGEAYRQAVASHDYDAQRALLAELADPDQAMREPFESARARFEGKPGEALFLGWLLEHIRPARGKESPYARLLLERHAGHEIWKTLAPNARHYFGRDPMQELEQLQQATPFDEVRVWVRYGLARSTLRNKSASEAQRAEANAELARIAREHPETIPAMAIAAPAFRKERLQVGMVAPEIEGADLDGKPFKLSDYRGKVVVLDFWGDW
ncbi:MAG: peroxiredoxin family protein [Planctomycetota bacterium]